MSIVHFVRHGQGTFDGVDYDRLSEQGCYQAEMLGTYWNKMKHNFNYSLSGTQKRHQQTAQIVADCYGKSTTKFPDAIPESRFNEIDSFNVVKKMLDALILSDQYFKSLAEKTILALQNDSPEKIDLFSQIMRKIKEAWIANIFPSLDIITWKDYRSLILETRSIFSRYGNDDRIAVFTSGNPIGIYLQEAIALTDSETIKLVENLYNTGITTLKILNDELQVVGMNEMPHLEEI